MTSAEPKGSARCGRCGRPLVGCAFCEREDCRDLLCYRCVRIALRQQVAEPHGHGG